MSPTQKKDKRGRPAKSKEARDADRALRKRDGERLEQALDVLGLTQAEVARRSGIRQGWINQIIAGERALGREDLRRLGGIGISPEFVLGLVDELVAPGSLRSQRSLEQDLAAHVERELATRVPLDAMGSLAWSFDARKTIKDIVGFALSDAKRVVARRRAAIEQSAALLEMSEALEAFWRAAGVSAHDGKHVSMSSEALTLARAAANAIVQGSAEMERGVPALVRKTGEMGGHLVGLRRRDTTRETHLPDPDQSSGATKPLRLHPGSRAASVPARTLKTHTPRR